MALWWPDRILVRLETREFWSAPAGVPWLPRLPRPTGADQSLACVGVSAQYYCISRGKATRLLDGSMSSPAKSPVAC
jgi:hypothetical protein